SSRSSIVHASPSHVAASFLNSKVAAETAETFQGTRFGEIASRAVNSPAATWRYIMTADNLNQTRYFQVEFLH
ncbi:MAG: hypothetical protein JWP75_2713, partial [Frondihabitans sp.]|nr:hypothetical protein [Frondihabitans sp.]